MALRLSEVEPASYEFVCTPTGNEPPEFESHLCRLEEMFQEKIVRLAPYVGDGLVQLIHEQGMIPNFRSRFCTRKLKIEPTIAFLKESSPCVHYVGLRADEPEREGIYGAMEGVTQRYPLREWNWGLEDVVGYLDSKGITIPETNCEWCFFKRLGQWKQLWKKRPESYEEAAKIEREMGHTFRSPQRDTWPAGLDELSEEFASGRKVPGYTTDRQLQLFDNCDMNDMCRVCSM